MICFLYFRLHENGERSILKARLKDAKIKRKRRHQLRKVLLVLDYIVECIGGLIILCVFFIGDQILLQHILLSIGSFVYGIPIPLAYLLNESRVRNIIVSKGWIEGFKSIFYSSEQIRQLERNRIVSFLHPEGVPKLVGGFVPISLLKCYSKKILPTAQKQFQFKVEKLISQLNKVISDKDIEGSPDTINCDRFIHNASTIEGNTSFIECDNEIDFPEHLDEKKDATVGIRGEYKIEAWVHTSNKGVNETKLSRKFSSNPDKIEVLHEINQGCNDTTVKNLAGVDLKNVEDDIESQILICDDKSFIQPAEEAQIVAKIFEDEDFKTFSRRHILKHTLRQLSDDPNESEYLKYFHYLCYLENYQAGSENNMDLIMSLINAWYLSKNGLRSKAQNEESATRKDTEHTFDDLSNRLNDQALERKRIIELLYFNVSLDQQYLKHLKELSNMEER